MHNYGCGINIYMYHTILKIDKRCTRDRLSTTNKDDYDQFVVMGTRRGEGWEHRHGNIGDTYVYTFHQTGFAHTKYAHTLHVLEHENSKFYLYKH